MNTQTSSTMDNDVINLAKAIRQTESGGNFNAKGGSGESGAYQWMPDTWKAHAKQALGDENAQMTPSNQNAVAYIVLKSWKDQGLNPAQIAAKWNSGSENGWENKRGVNRTGVQYDVPKYVKSVTDAYQTVKAGGNVNADPNNPSSTAAPQEPTEPQDGFFKSMVKGVVSPVATMLARPFQAGAELLGASAETVNKYTKGNFGDWVAPVPQNFSDVKKDVGRGLQTVALGLSPAAGGAAFGAGMSMEQGNDVLSWDTAFNTALGAVGGKAIDLVGRPLLNSAGKVVGKITPQILQDVAKGGAKAVSQFMAQHEILPSFASKGINAGANAIDNAVNAPFNKAGSVVSKPFTGGTPKEIEASRNKALKQVQEKNADMRRAAVSSGDNFDGTRARISKSNVLSDEDFVNSDNIVVGANTAADDYAAEAIGEGNKVVRELLKREGVGTSIDAIQADMNRIANKSFTGAELKSALNAIKREVAGLRAQNKSGRMQLDKVHDAKVNLEPKSRAYENPEKARIDKQIARAYKEHIEAHSKENIKEINAELAKLYADRDFIRMMQGKRVDSGKLGKHLARVGGIVGGAISGAAVGGIPGAVVGSYAGGAISKKLGSNSITRVFKHKLKAPAPKNKVLSEAVTRSKVDREQKALPAPSSIRVGSKKDTSYVKAVSALKGEPYRDPKTGQFKRVYLSGDRAEKKIGDIVVKAKNKIDTEKTLIKEAKKYKNVDEFIKAKGVPLYHGTNNNFEIFDKSKIGSQTDNGLFGRGFYFGDTKAFAKIAPKGRLAKNVMEVYPLSNKFFEINKIKTKEEMADLLNVSPDILTQDTSGIIRPKIAYNDIFSSRLQQMGFDGVKIPRGNAVETLIFEPDNIKTKSQLTDIWKKAQSS